jgi:hypothetical protein
METIQHYPVALSSQHDAGCAPAFLATFPPWSLREHFRTGKLDSDVMLR